VRWLVSLAVRLRLLVLAFALAVFLLGLVGLRHVPVDVFPEFAPPLVEIQTEAPGLSTVEVEALVTVPLESALNGTPWVHSLRSKSVLGLSSVVLVFEGGADLMQARQAVQERIAAAAARLPAVASPPAILPSLSSTSRVLKIGVTSERLSQMELSSLVRWTVRARLMAVPGVANVAIWGQRDRQLDVRVDPDRLSAHAVSLEAVVRAAQDAASVSGVGFLDLPNQRLAIRQRALEDDPDALSANVIELRNGAPIRLGDVAEVGLGSPAPIGDAVVNDGPGLLLVVEKQPWGNTLEVTYRVEAVLEELRPALEGIELDSTIFRPATFIEAAVRNLTHTLILGCVLVAAILFVFFYDWRAAVISLATIPLSLAAAVLVLRARGGTLDTMVIAGLVIAIGVVVDDAVIDVENITRRMRLNRQAAQPKGIAAVVIDASLEVRSAVVLATLIVSLVFAPVFFIPGVAGSFFRPLAVAYVLAILASMAVALTVTPALALMVLPGSGAKEGDAPMSRRARRSYRELLPWFVARPSLALATIAGATALTLLALPWLGEEFLPRFKERDFLMHWVEKPGTSLDAMRRITTRVSRELRGVPGVRNFGAHIGRAEAGDEVVGPNFAELWISVAPSADYEATIRQIQEIVEGYEGLYRDVLTYLRERTKEVLAGASASIVVRIYGPDLDQLRTKAREVAAVMAGISGVGDLEVEAQVLVPQIQVTPRPEMAGSLGLSLGQLRRTASTLVRGIKVGEVYRDQRVHDVVVIGEERLRHSEQAIRELAIETPSGVWVPLSDVAEVEIVPTPNEIRREGASRRIDVTCNASGRDLGSVAREIEARVRGLKFERGYHAEFVGEYQARQESRSRLVGLSGVALLAILLLLHADFGSWRPALLVFLTLPFALLGGVVAAFFSGAVLSLGSLVGFVSVLGIAARNGIMLISHYQHLQQEEGEHFGRELILRGAEERLVPILMTALCAGLALVPLVVAGARPGHEIEHPMAVVIVGGLITSTLLNLLLLPALFARFGRERS